MNIFNFSYVSHEALAKSKCSTFLFKIKSFCEKITKIKNYFEIFTHSKKSCGNKGRLLVNVDDAQERLTAWLLKGYKEHT